MGILESRKFVHELTMPGEGPQGCIGDPHGEANFSASMAIGGIAHHLANVPIHYSPPEQHQVMVADQIAVNMEYVMEIRKVVYKIDSSRHSGQVLERSFRPYPI
jgi:hypothetical protein